MTAPATPAPSQLQTAIPPRRRWSDGAGSVATADASGPWKIDDHWPTLVAALCEQSVDSSQLMLRALNFLVGAGRLHPTEAKTLGENLFRLRDTSLRAQQILRLATGHLRQSRDRVDLAGLITTLVEERRAELTARAISVHTEVRSLDVLLDPPVAFSLLNTVIDWALTFATSITFRKSDPSEPPVARLSIAIGTPAPAPAPQGATRKGRRLGDGLHWLLLQQIAASAGLTIARSGGQGTAVLTVEFPKMFDSSEGVSSVELLASDKKEGEAQDAWIMVLAKNDTLRAQAADALARVGLQARAYPSAADALTTLRQDPPNAIVAAYDIEPDTTAACRVEAEASGRQCPLIQITRDPPTFQDVRFDGYEITKVGQDAIRTELGPTVLFELAKAL